MMDDGEPTEGWWAEGHYGIEWTILFHRQWWWMVEVKSRMSRQAREQMDGVTISIASEPRGEGAVMVVVDVI